MEHYYYLQGQRVTKDVDLSEADKWQLVNRDPETIRDIKDPSPEILDFVYKVRPDLVPALVENVA